MKSKGVFVLVCFYFLMMLILAVLPLFAPAAVWRTGKAVHFLLEGQEVSPKHEAGGGGMLLERKSDVSWKKGSGFGYRFYRGPDLSRYSRVFLITPEGQKVDGVVYSLVNDTFYLADFVQPIRPGWSGTPAFDHKSGRCIGLVSGIRYFDNFLGRCDQYGIIGRIPPTFPEVPVEQENPENHEAKPGTGERPEEGGK